MRSPFNWVTLAADRTGPERSDKKRRCCVDNGVCTGAVTGVGVSHGVRRGKITCGMVLDDLR